MTEKELRFLKVFRSRIEGLFQPGTHLYEMWKSAPEERQLAMADAIAVQQFKLAGPFVQGGPSPEIVASWILGKHPTELAPGLSNREASLWIHQSKHVNPLDWYWEEIMFTEYPDLRNIQSKPSSIEVAKWLRNVLEDPPRRRSVFRDRHNGFAGHAVGGRIVDRLDEIKPCDLHRSPRRTIETAVARIIDEEWDGTNELIPHEEWHDALPQGIRILRHYTTLKTEGIRMRHCVVSYAQRVAERESVIFSVETDEGFSTAEFRQGKVNQHVGFANREPPEACCKAVRYLEREAPWATSL